MGLIIGKLIGLDGVIPSCSDGIYSTIGSLIGRPSKDCVSVNVFFPIVDLPSQEIKQIPYMREEAANALTHWKKIDYLSFVFENSLPQVKHSVRTFVQARQVIGTKKKVPIIIISHGLGGTYELYSKLCQDLASFGYFVIALEHEDGSASYALPYNSDQHIHYKSFPSDLSNTQKSVSFFRLPFLEKRKEEIEALLNWLKNPLETEDNSVDSNDTLPGELEYEKLFDFYLLHDYADLDQIFLLGHSFGACTAIYCSHEPIFREMIKKIVLLDAWTFPLSKSHIKKGIGLNTLSILSEVFSTVDEFACTFELFRNTMKKNKLTCLSYYFPGTNHSQFSDLHYITKQRLGFHGETPVNISQPIIVDAIIKFLKDDPDIFEVNYKHPLYPIDSIIPSRTKKIDFESYYKNF